MSKFERDYSQIQGWGVDADVKNDPTYPLKRHVEGEHAGYRWPRPPRQSVNVEVLHSNERPDLTAAFGTTMPPAGLSGVLRRFAFKFSESSYGHWLPLMLADRVGEVEGLAEDLAHGHVPNIIEELGWRAEWRHNRKSLVIRILVAVGAALIVAVACRSHKARSVEP